MIDPREYLLLRVEFQGVFTTPGCIQGSIYYSMMDPGEYLLLLDGSQGVLTTP